MMANTTNKDIETKVNRLERKVDSISQRQDEVLIPGIADIKGKLENLSFVSQKDYDQDMLGENGVFERLKNLEDIAYQGGLKNLNALNKNVSKLIVVILGIAIVAAIVYFAGRVFPAIGGI